MATYTNNQGNTYTFADGQPDFDDWVSSEAQRQVAWTQATEAYSAYQKANNGANPPNSDCDTIWEEWVSEVNAQRVQVS